MAEYYAQRASAGLIATEGTQPYEHSLPSTDGHFTPATTTPGDVLFYRIVGLRDRTHNVLLARSSICSPDKVWSPKRSASRPTLRIIDNPIADFRSMRDAQRVKACRPCVRVLEIKSVSQTRRLE